MKTLIVSDKSLHKINMNLLFGNIEFRKLTKAEAINRIPENVETIADKMTSIISEDLGRPIDTIKRLNEPVLCIGDKLYVAKLESDHKSIAYFELTIS